MYNEKQKSIMYNCLEALMQEVEDRKVEEWSGITGIELEINPIIFYNPDDDSEHTMFRLSASNIPNISDSIKILEFCNPTSDGEQVTLRYFEPIPNKILSVQKSTYDEFIVRSTNAIDFLMRRFSFTNLVLKKDEQK